MTSQSSSTAPQDTPWREGLLLRLDREAAKQVFAQKQPDALVELLITCVQQAPADQRCSLDGRWQQLHATLTTPPRAEVLAHGLLGGRPLPAPDGWRIHLIRPDLIPHLATALTELAPPDTGDDQQTLERVREFYTQTAEAGAAALFLATDDHAAY